MRNAFAKQLCAGLMMAYTATSLVFGTTAQAAPGDHIKVGATTFVPSLTTGFEFRTNAYLAVGEQITGDPRDAVTPALNFYLEPRVGIDTDLPQFRFTLDARYELRKYITPARTANLDRFNDFRVDLRMDVLRKAMFGFDVRSSIVNRNQNSDNPFFSRALLTQLRTDNGLRLHLRIGPDLQFSLGGALAWHNYNVPGVSSSRGFNQRLSYGGTFDVKWNFFPRTAAVLEASYMLNRWQTNFLQTNDAFGDDPGGVVGAYGGFLALPDSDHLKVMTGLRGRFTRNLVLAAMVGYGWGNYLEDSVTDEAGRSTGEADPVAVGFGRDVVGIDALLVLLRAELDFGFVDKKRFGQRVVLQYRKDFQDSFFVNYVGQNHIQAGLDSQWAKAVSSNLSVSARFEGYKGELPAERNDIVLRVDGRVNIEPTPWLTVTPRVFWTQRASELADIEYDDLQAHLNATFTY